MLLPFSVLAQSASSRDSVSVRPAKDSTLTLRDSLLTDSAKADSLVADSLKKRVRISDNAISSDVKYVAKDSISFDLDRKTVRMYNTAQVNYESIQLKGAYISYGFTDNLVYSTSLKDTGKQDYGRPEFKDNDQTYESDTIRYNFKSKKGSIKGVYTKMNNDGHLYGKQVKKDTNDVLYIKDGSFCPCEDKNAKTMINVQRIKVIPHDKIVTGWGYLSVGKIPTPLVFPFGYFPNNDKQSSGILIPSYGESPTLGFFLLNGGYYQPLGKKADLALTGDIYSKGSFGLKAQSAYKSNYKYSGRVNLTYNVQKTSYREFIDFSENKNFVVDWNHLQDVKSKPNTTFSATVRVGTGKAFRNNLNSSL
ncbi:MAG: putative LPS assembly protein LptD, partial [Bacteroidota bacterium]